MLKILLLLSISQEYQASIAGVTYMDDFDFEQRYRNLHECDPFYWHPLHLPDECADMFSKLIRSRISTPYHVMQESKPYTYKLPYVVGQQYDIRKKYDPIPYQHSLLAHAYDRSLESYETDKSIISKPAYYSNSIPVETEIFVLSRPRTPLDKLFELMRRDVKDNPSAPKITSIPYLGGVALYRQPVSFKTEAMIKMLSGAYAKAAYQP